jgi:hypothetical protein
MFLHRQRNTHLQDKNDVLSTENKAVKKFSHVLKGSVKLYRKNDKCDSYFYVWKIRYGKNYSGIKCFSATQKEVYLNYSAFHMRYFSTACQIYKTMRRSWICSYAILNYFTTQIKNFLSILVLKQNNCSSWVYMTNFSLFFDKDERRKFF